MVKVKVFYEDSRIIEGKINAWLVEAGEIEILQFLQAASGYCEKITVTIFYKTK